MSQLSSEPMIARGVQSIPGVGDGVPARPDRPQPDAKSSTAVFVEGDDTIARSRSRWNFHWLVIAAMPAAMLAINGDWIFGSAFIDAWVYHGFFRNLSLYLGDLFPSTYYGSRLAWVLPGYLAYQVLPAQWAHYALHLSAYLATLLAFYSLVARTADRRTALLGTVLFGCHGFVLSAIGWDYVDGAVILYYLLSLAAAHAAATRALRADTASKWVSALWLFLAGAAYACMIYSNLTSVLLSLSLPAIYIWTLAENAPRWREWIVYLARAFACVSAGAAIVSLGLCAFNAAIGGEFWFYGPSIRYATGNVNAPNPWRAQTLVWIYRAPWLPSHALGLVGGLVFLLRCAIRRDFRGQRWAIFFVVNYLYCLATMVYMEATGRPVLEFHYYVSFLLPPLFLAISAALARVPQCLPAWAFAILCLAAFGLLVIPLSRASHYAIRWIIDHHGREALWWSLGICVGLGAIAFLWRAMRPRGVATLSGLVLGVGIVNARVLPDHCAWEISGDARGMFNRVNRAFEIVQAEAGRRAPRFWHGKDGPVNDDYTALTSTYLWSYTLISYEFPQLSDESFQSSRIGAGSLLCVLTSKPNVDAAVTAAFTPRMIEPRRRSQYEVRDSSRGFFLTFFDLFPLLGPPAQVMFGESEGRVEGRLSGAAAEGLDAARLPLERWELAHSDATVRQTSKGLELRSPASRWAYIARYAPIRAENDGEYIFRMRFRPGAYRVRFGALNADQTDWRALPGPPYPADASGNLWEQSFSVRLNAGEVIWPLICNDHPTGDIPSSATVLEVHVFLPGTPPASSAGPAPNEKTPE